MPLVSTRQRDDDREEVLFLRRAPGIDSGTPLFLYFYFLPFFSLFSCPPSSVLHPLIHYSYVECERRKMQRCPDKIFVKRSPDYFLLCSIYPYERVRYLLFISLLKKIFVVENEILLLQNALLPFLQSTQKFGTLMSQILDCVA